MDTPTREVGEADAVMTAEQSDPAAPEDTGNGARAVKPATPSRRRRKPSIIEQARGAPASALLVAINLIVFALAERAGDTTSVRTLLRFGAAWRGLVWEGEYWRLVTSMFLHIGPIHLLCNSYFGFLLSARVEPLIGAPRFLALYLLSGVAGSAVSVIGHDAVSAGASGALFGLIGWELMTVRLRIGSFTAMWRNVAIRTNLLWLGGWFVLGIFAGFDNFAHAGGLVFGLAFAASLEAPAPRRRTAFTATLLALTVIVALSTRPLPVVHARELALRAAHSEADPAKVLALTESSLDSDLRIEALRLRGNALLRLGRYQDALVAAEEVIASSPNDFAGYVVRGGASWGLGSRERAEADFERALSLQPDEWARETIAMYRQAQ